jgi:Kef-type K+ transport system membrane component KefB
VYKFTGAGSITTTAGEVEVLIVGAGAASGGADGNGARILSGTRDITAATHTVAIGASGGTLSSVGALSSGPSGRALNSANVTGAGGTTAVPGTPFTSSIDGTSRTYAAGQSFGASSTTFGDGGSFAGVAFIAVG